MATTASIVALAFAPRMLVGCEPGCQSAVACRPNAFGIESFGMCITDVTSNCLVLGLGATDSGIACSMAKVYPTSDAGTCDITASFGDGTQSTITMTFTPLPADPCCPGTQYLFSPPVLEAFAADSGVSDAAVVDASIDVVGE